MKKSASEFQSENQSTEILNEISKDGSINIDFVSDIKDLLVEIGLKEELNNFRASYNTMISKNHKENSDSNHRSFSIEQTQIPKVKN